MSSLSILKSICLLVSCIRTLYEVLGSENSFLCFFLDCFLLKVWLYIYIYDPFWVNFCISWGFGSGFIFGLWRSNCIICWRDYSSSIKLILHLFFFFLRKAVGYTCVVLFLSFLILLQWHIYVYLSANITFFITVAI